MPARLIIRRPRQFADRFRQYQVTLNGHDAARVKPGEDVSFDLPPGPYVVQAKIDWCSSRPMALILADGDTVQLEVGSNLTGFKVFAALLYISVMPADYLYLRKAQPYGFAVVNQPDDAIKDTPLR